MEILYWDHCFVLFIGFYVNFNIENKFIIIMYLGFVEKVIEYHNWNIICVVLIIWK